MGNTFSHKKIKDEPYKAMKLLGGGQIGDVSEAVRNGNRFAVKSIFGECESEFKEMQKLEYDLKEMMSLSSPFLVRYIEIFTNVKNRMLYVVMELCDCDLKEFIENISPSERVFENDLKKIIIHSLLGLYILHKNGKIHRNIKPSNVFISGKVFKLGDYGLKRMLDYTWNDFDGHNDEPFYVAPEIFEGEYTPKADVWSLGVVFYYVCTKKLPFTGTEWDLMEKIPTGIYDPIPDDCGGFEVRTMINSMLQQDPDKRPTVQELLMSKYVKEIIAELDLTDYVRGVVLGTSLLMISAV